jgi:hypothetical protein
MDADIIESTAGEVAAELARRGIDPSRRVVIAVEPDDWLSRGHAALRPLVEAAGLTDAQLDLLIKEGRRAANEAMRLGDAPA